MDYVWVLQRRLWPGPQRTSMHKGTRVWAEEWVSVPGPVFTRHRHPGRALLGPGKLPICATSFQKEDLLYLKI